MSVHWKPKLNALQTVYPCQFCFHFQFHVFLIKNGNVYTANIDKISFNCAHLLVGRFDVANVLDFVCFFVPLTK